MAEKNEIRRMRTLLQKMAEMAEHAEQTGSFESGVRNYVKRYNAIVEHLEDNEVVPEELFPRLDEEETDFGQLGAEATLLSDYLSDMVDEASPKQATRKEKEIDVGPLIALAPFLEQKELSKLVRFHFAGEQNEDEEESGSSNGPDLKTIVGLAPHVDRATLAEMVRACLAHQKITDPHMLVALAPHMDRHEMSRLIREHMPQWFGGLSPVQAEEEKETKEGAEVKEPDEKSSER